MKTKRSLEWHRESQRNHAAVVERLRADAKLLQLRIERADADMELRARQIAEAERLGMDSFDPDRFLIPRRKRES